MFAFFNQATRARVCADQDGDALYSMRDPLWKLRGQTLTLTPNASAVGGLVEREAQAEADSNFVLWLERQRLAVNGAYNRWRGLVELEAQRKAVGAAHSE